MKNLLNDLLIYWDVPIKWNEKYDSHALSFPCHYSCYSLCRFLYYLLILSKCSRLKTERLQKKHRDCCMFLNIEVRNTEDLNSSMFLSTSFGITCWLLIVYFLKQSVQGQHDPLEIQTATKISKRITPIIVMFKIHAIFKCFSCGYSMHCSTWLCTKKKKKNNLWRLPGWENPIVLNRDWSNKALEPWIM